MHLLFALFQLRVALLPLNIILQVMGAFQESLATRIKDGNFITQKDVLKMADTLNTYSSRIRKITP